MSVLTLSSKSLMHLRKGTFAKTLASYLRNRTQERRLRWWDRQIDKRRICLSGYRFFGARLNLYFDSQLCRALYMQGYEAAEFHFLQRFLRPGDVFLDVGANIGIYSLVAAKFVGSAGFVHSFEPHRKTYDRLQENIVRNRKRNILSYNVAISDVAGSASLNYSLDGYDGWNSLTQPIKGHEFGVEEVSTMRLDDFCLAKDLTSEAIRMVKIDVEGWEANVLKGAERLLSHPKAPVLQMEFSEAACRNNGTSCDLLATQVTKFGFDLYVYDAADNRLTRIHGRNDCIDKNLLAIKNPDWVALRSGVSVVA